MAVFVRFGRRKAFLRRAVWISADPGLEERLNDMTSAWLRETGGPPIHDDDHDYTVAREISGRLGGHIARRIRPSSRKTAEVYMGRRQLRLDFS